MVARCSGRSTRVESHTLGPTDEAPVLIIKRKLGEQLLIADNIIITVRKIHAHEVSIGVDAPRNVEVDRMEVADRRKKRKP